jgi:anti-sigma regulatory factor (Ser/Thr protein kinase)
MDGRHVTTSRTRSERFLLDVLHHLDQAESALAASDVPHAAAEVTQARMAVERLLAARHQGPPPTLPERTLPSFNRERALPRTSGASRLARQFCRAACADWSVGAGPTGSATDVASELVANAVRVTATGVRLGLELSADHLLVRVWDDGGGAPRLLPYRPGVSERGLGLRIVKQLSTDWGWTDGDDGKWVWARIAVQPADQPAAAQPPNASA